MVKINSILSLLAVSSFYTLVAGMPAEETKYESDYCNDLEDFLINNQRVESVVCDISGDLPYIKLHGTSINQDIIDKIATYDGTLEYINFEEVSTIQDDLNLGSLKVNSLYFDNKHVPYSGEYFYIPKNSLKTAKSVTKISIDGFYLSQNNINDISSLTNLTELYIEDCTFDRNINYAKLENLKNLTSFVLSSVVINDDNVKRMVQFPEVICQMKKLNYLSLYRNGLTSLPKCIKNLKNLETLRIHLNKLQSLPKEIGNLTKLKVIYLDENQLETLPVQIGKLTKLEELYLEGNKISTLPDEFGNLKNIKKLDLSYNSLDSVPTSFGKLSKLERLNLRQNDINDEDVPEEVKNLPNLEILL